MSFVDSRVNILNFYLQFVIFVGNKFFKHKSLHLAFWEKITENNRSIMDFVLSEGRPNCFVMLYEKLFYDILIITLWFLR